MVFIDNSSIIKPTPFLKSEEEESLWKEYFGGRASTRRRQQIEDRIISAHVHLCRKIARKYGNYGIEFEELMSAAILGMGQAFPRFKLGKGARFGTYASNWIRAEVIRHVLDNSGVFKFGTTHLNKTLFFSYATRYKAACSNLIHQYGLDFNPKDRRRIHREMARIWIEENLEKGKKLGSVEDVAGRIEAFIKLRKLSNGLSLDMEIGEGDSTVADVVPDEKTIGAEEQILNAEHESLAGAFAQAALDDYVRDKNVQDQDPPRSIYIFQKRCLAETPVTLEDLAAEFSITRERVRQLEEKVKKHIKQHKSRIMAAAIQLHRNNAYV